MWLQCWLLISDLLICWLLISDQANPLGGLADTQTYGANFIKPLDTWFKVEPGHNLKIDQVSKLGQFHEAFSTWSKVEPGHKYGTNFRPGEGWFIS